MIIMATLVEIEGILAKGKIEEAYEMLNSYIATNSEDAQAWYLLGSMYRRQELWGDAINAYNKAKLLDPQGPAAAAIESIYDVLHFVNTDLMNP